MKCFQLRSKLPGRRSCGFTLVELLVVIGIIALLVSILLPALGRARSAARTVQCASNIRTILLGMTMYVAENKGWIPGGPNTSGLFLLKAATPAYKESWCPLISQTWDWQSPIATELNIKFEQGAISMLRSQRFNYLMSQPVFQCPENTFVSIAFTTGGPVPLPNLGTMLIPSYNTAMCFQQVAAATGGTQGQQLPSSLDFVYPPGYVPKINKVGDTSRKIFIADGARYATDTLGPDYDVSYNATFGGTYSDMGPFAFGRSWYRTAAPGNGQTSGRDARLFAYRHGSRTPFGGADTFKFNAGFFDGHVELLGDLQGSDPSMWVPPNTSIFNSVFFTDQQAFFNPSGGTYYTPNE